MAGTGNIHMSPQEMEAEAAGFERDNENFLEVIHSMRNRVNSLCETWEGRSSENFSMQFSDLEPGFSSTSELILSIAQQLRDISAALQDADEQIAAKIGVQ